jgi:hypothetical protein
LKKDTFEPLEFNLEKIIGIYNPEEKVRKVCVRLDDS